MKETFQVAEVTPGMLSRFGAPTLVIKGRNGKTYHTEPDNSVVYEMERYLMVGDWITVTLDTLYVNRITDFRWGA